MNERELLERKTLGSLGAEAARTRAYLARIISVEKNRQIRLQALPKPEKPPVEPVANVKAIRDMRLQNSMTRSQSEKWREATFVRDDLAKRFREKEQKSREEFQLKTIKNREALLAKSLIRQQRAKIRPVEFQKTSRRSMEKSLIFSTEPSPILSTLRAAREAAADSYYRRLGTSSKPQIPIKPTKESQHMASRTNTVDPTLIQTNQVYSPTGTMRSFRSLVDWEEKDQLPSVHVKKSSKDSNPTPLIFVNDPDISLPTEVQTQPQTGSHKNSQLEMGDTPDPQPSVDQDTYVEVLQARIQKLAKKYQVPLPN